MLKNPETPAIAIIGAGPAGIAAALQLNLFGIKPLIFEKNKIGGLLHNAFQVNNYPGLKKGINGIRLANNFKKQLIINNKVIFENVIKTQFIQNQFVISSDKKKYNSDYLIVASGSIAKPNQLSETDNKLIFSEIDLLLQKKNKKIAIIGAGDAACDYALSLSRNNEVSIFNKSNEIKCNEWLFKRFKKSKKIKYFENSQLKNIEKFNNALTLGIQIENQMLEMSYNYLIFAIGRQSNLFFLEDFGQGKIDKLILDNKLHIIGDAANSYLRQTGIAVGDGIKAAMKIFNESKNDDKSKNRQN